jgi:hypothetical protein
MTFSINNTERKNTEYYYSECRIFYSVMLNVIMLNFVTLKVALLNVVMLNVVKLSVVEPS